MNDTRGDYMNNRRKKRNKRIIIGVFVVVILVSVIGFFVGRKQSRLEKTLSNSISMRHHDGVGEILDHAENTPVPALRGLAHLCRNVCDLLVHAIEHPR